MVVFLRLACVCCQEVEVQQRLLHCVNQGTESGSTALLAVIPSPSLSLCPAHSLSRPPWRARKASSPVTAACKKKKIKKKLQPGLLAVTGASSGF